MKSLSRCSQKISPTTGSRGAADRLGSLCVGNGSAQHGGANWRRNSPGQLVASTFCVWVPGGLEMVLRQSAHLFFVVRAIAAMAMHHAFGRLSAIAMAYLPQRWVHR